MIPGEYALKSLRQVLYEEDQHKLLLCFRYKSVNCLLTVILSLVNAHALNLYKGCSFVEMVSFVILWALCLAVQMACTEIMFHRTNKKSDARDNREQRWYKHFAWLTYTMCSSIVFVPFVIFIYYYSETLITSLTVSNLSIFGTLIAYLYCGCLGGGSGCGLFAIRRMIGKWRRSGSRNHSGAPNRPVPHVYKVLGFFVVIWVVFSLMVFQVNQPKITWPRMIEYMSISVFYMVWLVMFVQKVLRSSVDEIKWQLSLSFFWAPVFECECFESLVCCRWCFCYLCPLLRNRRSSYSTTTDAVQMQVIEDDHSSVTAYFMGDDRKTMYDQDDYDEDDDDDDNWMTGM